MNPDFPDLLDQHMRRIRASASGVATEIGMSREAVNNWRRGTSKPSKKHRDKVVACTKYLRLSEHESNELLNAVGFEPEYAVFDDHQNNHVDAILNQLEQARPYPILLVLSQAHIDQPPQKQIIIDQAKIQHPNNRIIPVQMPYARQIGIPDFFRFLGDQIGLANITDDLGFEFALSDLLKTQNLTLLISRFEQINPDCQQALAGILRNLCEMHPNKINLILFGAEALSALKYAQGHLSLLNIAASHLLEFDVMIWLDRHLKDTIYIDENTSARALLNDLAGRHPALVRVVCQGINDGLSVPELRALIAQSELLFCDFNQVLKAFGKPALSEHLAQDELGPLRPYLPNPVTRKLFWLNLIRANTANQLVWQSESIQQFGINFLTEISK